jgi:transcriptional regulator with XRE-family HTH domain
MQGTQLKQWRETKGLSQRELAEMLDVSGPTLNRWEKGDQDIPGPAHLLLDWLINGKVPFGGEAGVTGSFQNAAWKLEMNLAAFQKLQSMALAEGYEDLVDYLGELARRELAKEEGETAAPETGRGGDAEQDIALLADEAGAPVPPRQSVVYPKPAPKVGRGRTKG